MSFLDPLRHYPAAHQAVLTLRRWLLAHYGLSSRRLPVKRLMTLHALYASVTDLRLGGYDVSAAPRALFNPIRTYLLALDIPRLSRRGTRHFPLPLLRRHNAILAGRADCAGAPA